MRKTPNAGIPIKATSGRHAEIKSETIGSIIYMLLEDQQIRDELSGIVRGGPKRVKRDLQAIYLGWKEGVLRVNLFRA